MMIKRITILLCLFISCISFSKLKGILDFPNPVSLSPLNSITNNDDLPILIMLASLNCLEILPNGYMEIKGPLLEHIKLHPEQFPKISAAIAANDINKVNAGTLPSKPNITTSESTVCDSSRISVPSNSSQPIYCFCVIVNPVN